MNESELTFYPNVYIEVFDFTNQILNKYCDFKNKENKAIDIRSLAKAFNVGIIEKKIIRETNIFQYGIQGYLDYYDYEPGKYEWTIYVNEEMGDLTKRYVIAHELAHFFFEK